MDFSPNVTHACSRIKALDGGYSGSPAEQLLPVDRSSNTQSIQDAQAGYLQGYRCHEFIFPKTSVVLLPPKAKEFDSATCMLAGLPSLGT